MPEHVHLLLSEPERETVAVAIKSLKQGGSRRLIGGRRALLAGAVLRLQHPQPQPVRGEAALHSPQSGQEGTVRSPRGLEVEQLFSLRHGI